MTRYLLDVAVYQGALKPADVKRAGFTAVNLKISHGLSRKNVHPDLGGWIDQAKALGLGISTFHYFTADAPGAAQAEYAYGLIRDLGLLYGTAHQLDVESDPAPKLADVRAYLELMTELLQRPVALYTARWWWGSKSWNVADLTPYLWSVPNSGTGGSAYPGRYPGDGSALWKANYGGWADMSVMQYAVEPLEFPDGTRGGIDVSKSAIRTESVWSDLTIGRRGVTYAPQTLKDARTYFIETVTKAGYKIDPLSVGIVGDKPHAEGGTSYHLGDDDLVSDAYSIVESPRDRAGLTDAAAALDIGWFEIRVAGKTHNLRTFSIWLVAQCKADTADTRDIREVIYSPDGKVVKRWDRLGKRTTGDESHLSHTHESWFRDSEKRDKTAHLRRYFTEILGEDDLVTTQAEFNTLMNGYLATKEGKAALAVAFLTYDPGKDPSGKVLPGGVINYGDEAATNPTVQPSWALSRAVLGTIVAYQVRDQVTALAPVIGRIAENVIADDGEKAEIMAAIQAAASAAAEVGAQRGAELTLAGLGGAQQSDEEIAAALKAALGPRAATVGALLA